MISSFQAWSRVNIPSLTECPILFVDSVYTNVFSIGKCAILKYYFSGSKMDTKAIHSARTSI